MTRLELWELIETQNYNKDCPKCYGGVNKESADKLQQLLNNEKL